MNYTVMLKHRKYTVMLKHRKYTVMLKHRKLVDRAMVIQVLIDTFEYESYLELGCFLHYTFNKINCKRKVGVDDGTDGVFQPNGKVEFHQLTTDTFFEQNNEMFDIIFIDADHHHNQVMKDFNSALKYLNPGGSIVLHDCNPCDLFHEGPHGCGTAWRVLVKLRERSDLDIVVCNFDHGTSIVRLGHNDNVLIVDQTMDKLTYDDLELNRKEWLNPQTSDEVHDWIERRKN